MPSAKRIRVGVIDSGVNEQHPHIGHIAGGIAIGPECHIGDGSYTDALGHGTAVMAAIQEKAPDEEYFAVKLFHGSLRTSAEFLLQALEWAINSRMDIVNLSLGTTNAAHTERFTEMVARAGNHGVQLVAAREAGGQLCLPGCLPGVISVGLDWDCPRDTYRMEGSVFYASGYPRTLPGVPLRRNLHGISFAVANMTGFVVRAAMEGQTLGATGQTGP
jgi:hypothetical protein